MILSVIANNSYDYVDIKTSFTAQRGRDFSMTFPVQEQLTSEF